MSETERGYENLTTGVFVSEDDAFLYALELLSGGTDEEKKEFEEWFYSGNWVKVPEYW